MNNKTLIVMGNGPSLKDVDFNLINNIDTFGLNAAYRYYQRTNWWPKYFGCFDYVVTESHKANFQKLINDSPIERFFFIKNYFAGPKFQFVNLRGFAQDCSLLSSSFDAFIDCGNSGTNACQVGIMMGYNKIILLGVDANYTEIVDGVIPGGVYIMDKTPNKNPNYWFDDYQQKGDRFNKPGLHQYQIPGWNRLASKIKTHRSDIDVVNCSPISKLECFRKGKLEDEI
jgi:hypothetical protein